VRTIKGLEKVEIERPGYDVEYVAATAPFMHT